MTNGFGGMENELEFNGVSSRDDLDWSPVKGVRRVCVHILIAGRHPEAQSSVARYGGHMISLKYQEYAEML